MVLPTYMCAFLDTILFKNKVVNFCVQAAVPPLPVTLSLCFYFQIHKSPLREWQHCWYLYLHKAYAIDLEAIPKHTQCKLPQTAVGKALGITYQNDTSIECGYHSRYKIKNYLNTFRC